MVSIEILARNFVMKNIATLFGVNLYRVIKERSLRMSLLFLIYNFRPHILYDN